MGLEIPFESVDHEDPGTGRVAHRQVDEVPVGELDAPTAEWEPGSATGQGGPDRLQMGSR